MSSHSSKIKVYHRVNHFIHVMWVVNGPAGASAFLEILNSIKPHSITSAFFLVVFLSPSFKEICFSRIVPDVRSDYETTFPIFLNYYCLSTCYVAFGSQRQPADPVNFDRSVSVFDWCKNLYLAIRGSCHCQLSTLGLIFYIEGEILN